MTLGFLNPILFGGNVSNAPQGGGTGTYNLSSGTLNVLNNGGSARLVFGAANGGTGTFNISGGTANVATNILVGSVAGSTGSIVQTGGLLSMGPNAHIQFGSGTGSYALTGGTLAIGGANAITGSGALSFGNATLQVQGSNFSSSNAATLLNGTRFTVNTNGLDATWGGILSGGGGLAKNGDGTLTLTAANTYTGGTSINAGTLALGGAGRLNSSGAFSMAAGTNFDLTGLPAATTINVGALSGSGTIRLGSAYLDTQVGAGQSTSFSGTILSNAWGYESNYGRFYKSGAGDLLINGSTMDKGEGYITQGSMTQSAGTTAWSNLNVGSSNGANGTLNVSGGTLSLNVGLRVGDFGGTGTVNQTGGTVLVRQACALPASCASFNLGNQGGNGTYNISAGSLLLQGGSHAIGRNAGNNPASQGTLNISGTGLVELSPTADSNGFLVIGDRDAGTQPNSTGIVNQSGGTLRVLGTSELYLGGHGSGTYNLTGGALEIGGASLRGNYGASVGPYAFNLGGGTIRVIGSDLTTSVNATLASATRSTIDTNGLNATWGGVLSGGGSLAKNGDGTLTLTAANTYTGGTSINAGTLALSGAGRLNSSGAFSMAAGTNFDLTGLPAATTVNVGALSGSGTIRLGSAYLDTQVGAGQSTSFSGTILSNAWGYEANYGRFYKSGAGDLLINGSTMDKGEGYITQGSMTQSAGTTAWSTLNVGSSNGANGTLNVSGGTLSLNVGLRVGDFGGTGTVNQTGGTVLVRQDCALPASCASFNLGNQGGNGTYNISAGSLLLQGGSHAIGRNAGNNPASQGTLNISGTGLVELSPTADSNGFLVIGDRDAGTQPNSTGIVNQSGGTLRVLGTSELYLGGHGSGTYNLTGGALEIGGASLRGNYGASVGPYAFNLGGGTVRVIGSDLTTSVNATLASATRSTIDTNGLNATWSGVLSGSGGLVKDGTGMLTLTGTNTYSGGTTVATGGLKGSTSSLQGDIVNNGLVVFDQGTAGTYAGNMSGSGSLTKEGTGVLTLTGNNSYAGGTLVSGGTLRLGSATALTPLGALVVNGGIFDMNGYNLTVDALAGSGGTISLGSGTLTANDSGNTVLSTTITGTGGLNKSGSGNLVLTGTNTYTGPTDVSGGRLAVNGSITSNVTVDSGGNLGGSGTIFGSVVNSGTVSPGNSIGTLTVNGTYSQTAGSTYQVETNSSGQSDRINVTGAPGTATINGSSTVQVLAASGTYLPRSTYTILNATGGITGAYAGVTTNFAFLQGSLSYDANNVYLVLNPGGFANGAATGNQASVGAALDRSVANATGDFATVLGTLSTATLAQGQSAMSTLGGQNYAGFGTANVGSGMMFMSALGQQLAAARGGDPGKATRVALAEACEIEACAPSPWTLWATGLAGFGTVAGNGNTATMTYGLGGAATGIDYRLSPGLLVGGGVGFASGDQWTSGLSGKGSTDSYQFALYASYAQPGTQGGFWADALAGFAYNDNRMTRQILLPGLTRTATASTGAAQFLGQIEAGYRVALPVPANATIAPFARLQGTTLTQNGFTENGAGSINLTVAGQTTSSLRSTLGAEMTADLPTGASSSIGLLFRLGWVHDYANTQRPVTASFAGAPGSNFTVLGAAPARDAALLAFSASTAIAEATSIYARYDGEVGGGTSAHAITAGFRMSW